MSTTILQSRFALPLFCVAIALAGCDQLSPSYTPDDGATPIEPASSYDPTPTPTPTVEPDPVSYVELAPNVNAVSDSQVEAATMTPYSATYGGILAWVSTEVEFGTAGPTAYCFKVVSGGAAQSGFQSAAGAIDDLEAGRTYYISLKVLSDESLDKLRIGVVLSSNLSWTTDPDSGASLLSNVPGQWTELTTQFTCEEDTSDAYLFFNQFDERELTWYVDDVRLYTEE